MTGSLLPRSGPLIHADSVGDGVGQDAIACPLGAHQCRLGDGKGFEKEIAKHPDKFAFPHALTVDSHGDLYVIEWLPFGRPRKFTRTPV